MSTFNEAIRSDSRITSYNGWQAAQQLKQTGKITYGVGMTLVSAAGVGMLMSSEEDSLIKKIGLVFVGICGVAIASIGKKINTFANEQEYIAQTEIEQLYPFELGRYAHFAGEDESAGPYFENPVDGEDHGLEKVKLTGLMPHIRFNVYN